MTLDQYCQRITQKRAALCYAETAFSLQRDSLI
jgi:hypothetical protein